MTKPNLQHNKKTNSIYSFQILTNLMKGMKIILILIIISLLILTGCGPLTPTQDEIERGGYNEEGEKTCRCFTLFKTDRTCKCMGEVLTGQPQRKE